MLAVLLTVVAASTAPSVTVQAGPLTLEVGLHRGGQVFHIVDQLSDWHVYCHPQYRRQLARFSGPEEALLVKHAAIRKARGYGVLDQVFYPADDWRAALDAAVRDGKLTTTEGDTERAVLDAFEPRLKTLLDEGQKTVERATAALKKRGPELEAFARKAARFTGTTNVKMPLYLVPSPGSGGGGGANGGSLVVEVGADSDPYYVVVHEAWHAFVEGQSSLLDAAAKRPPGLDRTALSEGFAYAINPGIFHAEPGDPLARKVKSDINETKRDERFLRYALFNRLGLALRPLLVEALDDPHQTLVTFLPRACDVYRAIESLTAGLDGPGVPGIFVFGPNLTPIWDRAIAQKVNVWGRKHSTEGYATLSKAQPGDHVLLLFTSADLRTDPPADYRDLLPLPLEKVRAAVAAGKPVEAEASRRQWHVLLLAAPDDASLVALSRRSSTLARWWP
jgi:hypothetical protein